MYFTSKINYPTKFSKIKQLLKSYLFEVELYELLYKFIF